MTLDEFQRGQLYFVALHSAETTNADGGVEIMINEPYDNRDGHWGVSKVTGIRVPLTRGQYTMKRYHIKSKFPSIVTAMLPENAMFLIEECWNAYPHIRTVIVNAYFSVDKFHIDLESMHVEGDTGLLSNAVSLSADELKERKVEFIDIAVAGHDTKDKDYKPERDSVLFKSKTGRGPLAPGWMKVPGVSPVMCCYKVARVAFKYFPMQGTVEGGVASSQLRLFGQSMGACFCLIDAWGDMSMDQIRAYEAEEAAKSKVLMDAYLRKSAAPATVKHMEYARAALAGQEPPDTPASTPASSPTAGSAGAASGSSAASGAQTPAEPATPGDS